MFLHLNRDNVWPDFQRIGLDRLPDGSVVLSRVPLLEGGGDLTALPSAGRPGGSGRGAGRHRLLH